MHGNKPNVCECTKVARVPTAVVGGFASWNGNGMKARNAIPRFIPTTKVPRVCDEPVVLIDPVVDAPRLEDGENGEHVDECLIGEPEYREAVVGSCIDSKRAHARSVTPQPVRAREDRRAFWWAASEKHSVDFDRWRPIWR